MKQRLARIITLYTTHSHTVTQSHTNGFRPNPHLISSSSSLSSQKHRLFTSKSHGVITQQPSSEENKEESINEADVNNKDLKKSLKRLMDGDEEAIPSIFEAILKRNLAGKGDESYDDLMKELRELPLVDDDDDESDKEFDSDHDELENGK